MSLSASLVGPLRSRISEASPKVSSSRSWYRQLFKAAFVSAWKNKFIWFFGFFAAIIGTGSEIITIYDSFNRANEGGPLFDNLRAIFFSGQGIQWSSGLQSIFSGGSENLLIAGGLLAALVIVLGCIAVLSQGSLVYASTKIDEGQGIRPTWSVSWKQGVKHFWKVLGVNVVGKILFGVAYILFTLPLLFLYSGNSSGILQTLLVLLGFIIVIPLVLLISLFVKFVVIAVVSRDTSIREGFREARQLVKNHWLVVVEFVVLLFLIDVAAFAVLRLGMAVLALPFLFAISLFYAFVIPIGASLFYILWIVASLLFVFFLTAFISSFQYLAWVKLYHALLEGSLTSKLVRWVYRFTNREPRT